jgi:hypothetical protein
MKQTVTKKRTSTLRLLTLITLSVFLGTSCFTTKRPVQTPPPMTAMKFDYVPPTEGITKSNDIKFSLIKPRFAPSIKWIPEDPFKTFIGNMSTDFVEMLSARGYPYIGPYESYDEMVYNDKKTTDLVLETEVDFQITGDYLKQNSFQVYDVNHFITKTEYYYDGQATITGNVNLIFSEPFTKTKVWVKSVPIEPTTYYLKSYYRYNASVIPNTDPQVWNTTVENLEAIYTKTLRTAWNHLEPDELKVKKKEAGEIKANSGFQKK